jgi:hypothetical protein
MHASERGFMRDLARAVIFSLFRDRVDRVRGQRRRGVDTSKIAASAAVAFSENEKRMSPPPI